MPKVIGHEAVRNDLQILAEKGALSHSYLFYGPSMVGKRTTALALAHFLEKGSFEKPVSEPGREEVLMDGMVVDLAFAQRLDPNVKDSIGIDAAREIKNFLWQKPNASPRRTLIVDDAELLTTEAQNALLKVTEEPPASSLLIVIASDLESVMGTIRSRLQQVYFGLVAEKEIAAWLGPDAKKSDIARKAMGKPGLAWRLANDPALQAALDQAQTFLKTPATGRRDFIKKLIEPDDFKLRAFLEAVIMTLAWEKPSKAKAELWHRVLTLRDSAGNFGLNPRLQLESLLI